MTMNKMLIVFLLLCLFFGFSVQIRAMEKYIPESYQYTFTVGSLDFHGVVDGVEGTGALLYPIYIDETCGRAGISVYLPCPDGLCVDVRVVSVNPKELYLTFGCSEKGKLTLHYPSQKVNFNDEEIPNPFPIKDVQGVNTDAYWDGPNAFWDKDSHIPELLTVSIAPLRLVFEFTGHKVDWNPDTQEITVTYPAPEAEE
jgi:hypothetical protein